MKTLGPFFILITAFVLFARPIHAAIDVHFDTSGSSSVSTETSTTISGEHIENFKSDIHIRHDGTIRVIETIIYDFGYQMKHGIYRSIPTIKTNKEGKKFRLTIADISVQDEENNVYQYQKSTSDGVLTLKIGDPNRTITGVHTYIIQYMVSGAITYFSDHDELYWNATGNEWTVPIAHASSHVELDGISNTAINAVCYTGEKGSAASDCTSNQSARASDITSNDILYAGQGLTFVFGFPKGLIQVLEPKEVINFSDTPIGKVLIALLSVAVFIVSILWNGVYPLWIVIKWFKSGRDPKPTEGEVSAWYDPPRNTKNRFLTPAETGTLVDETADTRDIFALVVDLARRGYLTIRLQDNKDTVLEKKKLADGDVLPYEKDFLLELFKGRESVHLKKTTLTTVMKKAKDDLHSLMVTDGFFDKNPEDTRNFYTIMLVLGLFTMNMPLFIVALLFGRNMPSKTQTGAGQAARARSLKNFLSTQERQLEFQAEKQYFFEKLLPYAVAFGIESVWIKRLVDMGISQPDWFVTSPGYVFSASTFSNSMSSTYSGLSYALSPTTSSSGFSSGFSGGFSGGGGGGGGGGSW